MLYQVEPPVLVPGKLGKDLDLHKDQLTESGEVVGPGLSGFLEHGLHLIDETIDLTTFVPQLTLGQLELSGGALLSLNAFLVLGSHLSQPDLQATNFGLEPDDAVLTLPLLLVALALPLGNLEGKLGDLVLKSFGLELFIPKFILFFLQIEENFVLLIFVLGLLQLEPLSRDLDLFLQVSYLFAR